MPKRFCIYSKDNVPVILVMKTTKGTTEELKYYASREVAQQAIDLMTDVMKEKWNPVIKEVIEA
jgi:hypothetical protein